MFSDLGSHNTEVVSSWDDDISCGRLDDHTEPLRDVDHIGAHVSAAVPEARHERLEAPNPAAILIL